jgi:ferrochelatase
LVDIPVEIGMRYAEPSIETGIRSLVEKGVKKLYFSRFILNMR